MRMDQRAEVTAADLVNQLSLRELEEMLWEYGEERWARRIAKAIVEERRPEADRDNPGLEKDRLSGHSQGGFNRGGSIRQREPFRPFASGSIMNWKI